MKLRSVPKSLGVYFTGEAVPGYFQFPGFHFLYVIHVGFFFPQWRILKKKGFLVDQQLRGREETAKKMFADIGPLERSSNAELGGIDRGNAPFRYL